MANISVTIIAKIIEGAIDNDMLKVKSYAELLANNLDKDGETRGARIIRNRLDGTYKTFPQVVLE